jgi:hypothetical protein
MENCNLISTLVENGLELRKSKVGNIDPTYFKSLIGSLRYLTCTKLNILYGVKQIYGDTRSVTFKYSLENSSLHHYCWILRY